MSKHTKGPWNTLNKTCICAGVDEDGDDRVIAVVQTGAIALPQTYCRPKQTEQEANARLIAAAPELLQMIKHVINVHSVDMCDDLRGKIHRLIAKAEGNDAY